MAAHGKKASERAGLYCVLSAALMAGTMLATAHLDASGALAQSSRPQSGTISIPPGPLTPALNRLAARTGLQILYDANIAEGRRTNGVSGAATPNQALSALLAGTGVTFRYTGANTVTIVDASAADGGATIEGAVALDTIDVSGGGGWQTDPDRVYETPAGVSAVTSEMLGEKFAGDVDSALRSVPGTFTRMNESSAGVGVNIRGFEGFGRVNMMIDGVRQSFRVFGHGVNGGSTYVDPALLAGVEIARGAVTDVTGIGALAGSANFRTLNVDDILLPGRNYGMMNTVRFGTNGYNASVMSSAAMRSNGTSAAVAFSHHATNDYESGRGKIETGTWQDLTSGLAKLNFGEASDHKLSLGAVWYDNDTTLTGSSFPISNQTYTIKYRFNPGNDLINLRVNAAYNITEADYTSSSTGAVAPVRNEGLSFDFTNTSIARLGDTTLTFDYGAAYVRDDVDNGGNALLSVHPGRQDVAGAFATGKLSWGIFDLIGGLRYDYYAITGTTAPIAFPPAPGSAIDNSGGEWSPKLTLAAKPLSWLQLYGTYEHSFRPPTVSETLFPGVHGVSSGTYANPDLKGERSRGWEAGINILKNGLFAANDVLRLKANYFRADIEDYVAFDITDMSTFRIQFTNLAGVTPISGVELQGSYDAGFAYVNVAYTNSDITLPQGIYTGSGAGDLGQLPTEYLTLDLGVRLLDQKLTLGGQMRWVGSSLRTGTLNFPIPPPIKVAEYTLFDAYASFKVNESVKLFINAENVTDVYYMPALKYHLGDAGPGRRIIGGATLRF